MSKWDVYFLLGDSQALATKINQMILNKNVQEMSQAGVEIVSKYFTAKNMSKNYQNLYIKAIAA